MNYAYCLSSRTVFRLAMQVAAILFSCFFVTQAYAADRYWTGSSDRWESAANWASGPTGGGGAGVPAAGDTAILRGSGGTTIRIRSAAAIGGLRLNPTWTGSLLQGTGSLRVGTTGIRVGSGRLVGGNALLTTSGSYTQTGGIVTGIQNTFTLSGSLSITKGASSPYSTFTSTGTIIFDGNADQNLTVGANVTETFWNLTLENAGSGSSDDVIVNVNGGLNLSGALLVTLGNLDLTTNSQTMNVERGITLADAAQATLTTNSNVTASGTILVNDAATLTVTAGTWTLNDDGDQSVDLDGQSLYDLTLNNTGGTTNDDVIIDGGGLNVENDVTVTVGHLDMNTNDQSLDVDGDLVLADDAQASLSGATINIAGNLTVYSSATFTHTSGTVTLDGTNQTLSGSITFYNLTKGSLAGPTLTFAAGETQTIVGTLTLSGASVNPLLKLRSSLSGTQWRINPQGTRTVSYLDIKDSNNTNATAISCSTGCDNSGNNTNWTFATTTSVTETESASGGGGGSRRGSPGGDGLHPATDSSETGGEIESEAGLPAVRGFLETVVDGQSVVFTDVPTREWFAAYVWDVIQAGIASGYRDVRGRLTGEFGPANPVTYAEIAKMALEAAGEDVSAVSGIPVNRSAQKQWSESYIKLAEELQLSTYTIDLDVNGPATRGAVVLTIVESLGLPLSEGTGDYSDLRASHPHVGAIATATALGIISGDTDRQGNLKGTVRPDDLINRAEVAKILTNVLSLEP